MDHIRYRDGELWCEGVPAAELAMRYGTPLFAYSRADLLQTLSEIQNAFAAADPLICYSIKSNPNLHIARLLGERGAGFDVTSGGELHRALLAGGTGPRVVFAGVGKTDAEMRAGLEAEVVLFNVESEAELHALAEVARQFGKPAPVALRVNPALPPKTHAKTDTSIRGTKFGLDIDTVLEVASRVVGNPHLEVIGLHMHLGSPIVSPQPYREGAEKGVRLIEALRAQGHGIEYLNMGGGFGINYHGEDPPTITQFADAILPAVRATGCKLILEPGRCITGNAGVLISRVIYTKESGGRTFVIQDAGMNDLIRPTLYEAYHRIWPVMSRTGPDELAGEPVDVVGPVCETGDYLAHDRRLPEAKRGDLLAVFGAGAYGAAMSSNYNSRLRAAEALVHGNTHRLIRRRETIDDLVRCELEVD